MEGQALTCSRLYNYMHLNGCFEALIKKGYYVVRLRFDGGHFLRYWRKIGFPIILWIYCIALSSVAFSSELLEGHFLKVEDMEKGNTILLLRVEKSDTFTIKEIHSLTRTPVWDTFMIDEKYRIKGDKSVFSNPGYGGPTPTTDDLVFTSGDQMVIDFSKRDVFFEDMVMRVAFYHDHTLIFRGNNISLGTLVDKGGLVRISVCGFTQ